MDAIKFRKVMSGETPGTHDVSIDDYPELLAWLKDNPPDLAMAPTWIFDALAIDEILTFWGTLTFDEFTTMMRGIDVPSRYIVAEVFHIPFIVVDTRDIVHDEHPSAGLFAMGTEGAFEVCGGEVEFVRMSTIARACVAARCYFKNRYVEVLTKHQLRSIKRGATLKASEPRVIRIAWDAPTPRYVAPSTTAEHTSQPTGRRVCFHEVQGHPRHLRSGKVVWVSGHARGSKDVPRKTKYVFTGHKE